MRSQTYLDKQREARRPTPGRRSA